MAERRGIPHHLLDVWDVTATASVAEYQVLAERSSTGIEARGKVPVLVGGSGLYVRAALGDLDFPGTDERIRARLETELAAVGAGITPRRLVALDPGAAAAILPSNGRRIVRALEVIELSGRPFSATLPGYDGGHAAVQIGLALTAPELDRRIEARVDRMWAAGFVGRGARAARARGTARRQDGEPRARLPAGAALPGRGVDAGPGAGGNGARHAPFRPPPGVMVPPRPARHMAASR